MNSQQETLNVSGELIVVKRDEVTGEESVYNFKNLIVTLGRNYIASRMISHNAPATMTHMAVGTGTTGAQATDTGLQAELANGRVGLTIPNNQSTPGSVTANEVTYTATFGTGVATGALTEAGIFNASTSGAANQIMLCRTVFSVINKGPNDSITITWKITVAVA